MKLLIITQVIDTKHPILGFFHRWVEEFAKHCEQVHVIALQVGDYNLPTNVTVHSLGKEKGKGRLAYLFNFYRLIWSLRNEYDPVFVHMNQLYVVLGAWLWSLLRKKIALWYTHGSVSLSLRLATFFSTVIFTASPESFRVASKKVVVTGHGIDTARFAPQIDVVKDIDLITIGRISPVKNLEALISALAHVRQHHTVSLSIVGTTLTQADRAYEEHIKQLIASQGLSGHVHFLGNVAQSDLASVLNRSRVFVTASKTGSLDKVILEAMACGVPVASLAEGSRSLPLQNYQTDSEAAFFEALNQALLINEPLKSEYVDYVARNHSLTNLVQYIYKTL